LSFKKITGIIHLWLGFTVGLLVFIIAITGSLYVFKEEIEEISQPYRFVVPQDKNFLPPSELKAIAETALPDKIVHAVMYQGKERAAKVIFYHDGGAEYYNFVYVNQYNGEVLQITDELSGFFPFVLDGHFYLWLPDEIGKPVVAIATLIFFVMLVTGIIIWWPKNKNGRKQRFTLKWKNARWRRKNYDMHNVLGFYVSWIGIIFVITGLVWGFEWFMHSYHFVASGGETYKEYVNPQSTKIANAETNPIDKVWYMMQKEYPGAGSIEIHPPEDASSPIAANANPDPQTYWKVDYRYFDQYSMKELSVDHMWGRFANTSGSDKLMRMNYDIHVGAIAGLPGKILAFLASLIIASLPVTGFMIWWGRRKKAKAGLIRDVQEEKMVEATI
jgi:uncharacterized iron-regulated membrane protein